jgi:hypothetical protein
MAAPIQEGRPGAQVRGRPGEGGRSRVTAAVRLVAAAWLMGSAFFTLGDPQRVAAERGAPIGMLLPLAGLHFALGVFLLSGFMSRAMGLALVGLALWEVLRLGLATGPLVLAAVGLYVALRGGGAWAMDAYVQAMQERVRRREAERALSRRPAAIDKQR